MIGIILNAVLNEAKAFLQGQDFPGQVMLKTDFVPAKIPDYGMPFLLLALEDGEDSFQYPGGLTQMGWRWGLNSYNFEPDGYVDDESGYSTGLLYKPIDTIRRHFSSAGLYNGVVMAGGELNAGICYQVQGGSVIYNGFTYPNLSYFTAVDGVSGFTSVAGGYVTGTSWLTPGMPMIFNRYGFQFTLAGVGPADPLEAGEGLVMGFRINFVTTAFDDDTEYVDSDTELETITQLAAGDSVAVSTSVLNKPFVVMDNVSTNTAQVIPPNTFVVSIGLKPVDGQMAPTSIAIGYEAGGGEILEDTVFDAFQLIMIQQYYEFGTVFYFTPTGAFGINIKADLNYL